MIYVLLLTHFLITVFGYFSVFCNCQHFCSLTKCICIVEVSFIRNLCFPKVWQWFHLKTKCMLLVILFVNKWVNFEYQWTFTPSSVTLPKFLSCTWECNNAVSNCTLQTIKKLFHIYKFNFWVLQAALASPAPCSTNPECAIYLSVYS